MSVYAWAVARKRDGVIEYYADEVPGSDEPRWVLDPDDCCAYEHEGYAATVRESLVEDGYADTFVTTIEVAK